ncbi:MAG: divergent polysaccharide deacetylase family protein [Gammaproteobacteria bacterium]|nr:MAG: divergent polysaccharide deacetylase family protein [Gammaproteobacteria bacterium]
MLRPSKFLWMMLWLGWSICTMGVAKSGNIFILIDDIGTNRAAVDTTLSLPPQIGISILPHTPYAHYAADKARHQGRTIFLHAPMEAVHHNRLLGPGALWHNMRPWQIWTILDANLKTVPGAIGINHHMGSRLTTMYDSLFWVMAWTKWRRLMYLDSRTTKDSIVPQVANQWMVPSAHRDVFLDTTLDEHAIHKAFDRLLQLAQRQSLTIAIGHPHPVTLSVLRERLKSLPHHIRLVSRPASKNLPVNPQQHHSLVAADIAKRELDEK